MSFKDGTFAKGLVNDWVLVGPVRHFDKNGILLNITDAITSKCFFNTQWTFGGNRKIQNWGNCHLKSMIVQGVYAEMTCYFGGQLFLNKMISLIQIAFSSKFWP